MSEPKINYSSDSLMLLITVVDRRKAEFFSDLIQSLGANLQFMSYGEGTADASMLSRTGLTDSDKAMIFSVIREEAQDRILEAVSEKFETVRNGKGIAYTVPFSSIIGASVYHFLADHRSVFQA